MSTEDDCVDTFVELYKLVSVEADEAYTHLTMPEDFEKYLKTYKSRLIFAWEFKMN